MKNRRFFNDLGKVLQYGKQRIFIDFVRVVLCENLRFFDDFVRVLPYENDRVFLDFVKGVLCESM